MLVMARAAQAQSTVAGALAALAVDNTANLVAGGVNAAANTAGAVLSMPSGRAGALPQCQATRVLLNAGGFPANWGSLTAEAQAAHPINMPIFQLGYAVYQDPGVFKACLGAMGVDAGSIKMIRKTTTSYNAEVTAFVLKAATERIFVIFRGSEPDNFLQDASCRHTQPLGAVFGAPGQDVRVHAGFMSGWTALEADVLATVKSYLASVPSGEVYVLGHSLGAAMAQLAALRLNAVLPAPARVAGVWLLASPRAGNPVYARVYNAALLAKTLRFSNFQDFAVRMPAQVQSCSVSGLNLAGAAQPFAYAHVGRSLLMCPDAPTGLTQWRISPLGSDVIDCSPNGPTDTTGATHMLGSYFDAWRRGHLLAKGSDLATDPRTLAVMCQECAYRVTPGLTALVRQLNVPARAGGPVTCGVSTSCSNQRAWNAATSVGRTYAAAWDSSLGVCTGFRCT